MRVEHSRALLLGRLVGMDSEQTLASRLEQVEVGLSIDPDRSGHIATAEFLLNTLARLPVGLALESSGIADGDLERLSMSVASVRPDRPLRLGGLADSTVRAHIGVRADASDVIALPVRHGGRVGRRHTLADGPLPSGLGIATAAALAAAEIFEIAAAVRPDRGLAHDQLSWCPVTLTSRPEDGPAIESTLNVELALVGLGAIGSAAARILSTLPLHGRVQLVDPERFGPENLGTYSLGTLADSLHGEWKVDLAASVLRNLHCETFRVPVEELIDAIDNGATWWPRTVLSGLDSVPARHAVQRLWPDELLDGATGETMCGLHHVRASTGACLMCLFPARVEGPSAAERLSSVTGIAPEVLRYGDQPLKGTHLRGLPEPQRAVLLPEVGKPICGLARAIGLTTLEDDGYQPAVTFVAQQAACLMIGRLLAIHTQHLPRPNFVQYDALIGPQAATLEDRRPDPQCYCQRRRDLVSRVRALRGLAIPIPGNQ